MTTNIAKIRAALESIRSCDDMEGERDAALAALAELEKSASPQFVAGVVTDDVAARVLTHFSNFPVRLSNAQNGRDMIAAVRSELGPALGLVEIREPTPEKCDRIKDAWINRQRCGDFGRAMFDAVHAVMRPKEGL